MASAPQARLDSLQVGRGIAAFAVLLHHAEQSVVRFSGNLPAIISVPFSYGYLGVDFFFVLSGFIIYYVSHARVDEPGWPRSYVESRLTRVFIPYLPVSIAVAFAYMALPSMASGENDWNWFSTLTLLPSQSGPALAPAWTLQHELAFYAVAFLCLYYRKVLLGCIIGGTAAVSFDLLMRGTFKAFSMVDLEFIFGIFVAWCFINGKVRYTVLPILAGLALCAAFFVLDGRNWTVIFGLGVACLLLPIVRAETSGHLQAGAPLILLGNASYAIYLLHHPMVSVLVRALQNAPPLASLVITVAVPLGAGIAYHLTFEQRALDLSRDWLRKKSRLAETS